MDGLLLTTQNIVGATASLGIYLPFYTRRRTFIGLGLLVTSHNTCRVTQNPGDTFNLHKTFNP
jgi:hypothetical protein